MDKKTKYALSGALWLGLGNGALNAIDQLNKGPMNEFNWEKLLTAIAKGALLGGAGGFVIGAWVDYLNNQERPINTDASLFELAKKVQLNTESSVYKELCSLIQ